MEEIEGSVPSGNPLNNQFESTSMIFTIFNSTTDVDNFCNAYNHDNNYNGLKIGQRIRINDGTYNTTWRIAGFDMESNQIASDGSIYDNGYGICLIPDGVLVEINYDYSSSFTPYTTSYIRNFINNQTSNILRNILGNHLVNRNVLLGSGTQNDYGRPVSYSWTTDYCTLISIYQLFGYTEYIDFVTGTKMMAGTIYDVGEANYKLPLFNYISFACGYAYWLRANAYANIYQGNITSYKSYCAREEYASGINSILTSYLKPGYNNMSQMSGGGTETVFDTYLRPMIYIR